MPDRWQGLDAEAGALLEALGCDTGRGEHEETAAALRRAFEAGAREAYEEAAAMLDAHFYTSAADRVRGLLDAPEREEQGRGWPEHHAEGRR